MHTFGSLDSGEDLGRELIAESHQQIQYKMVETAVRYGFQRTYCTIPSTVPTGRSTIPIHPSTILFLASSELTF
jgi:hypothetical protein